MISDYLTLGGVEIANSSRLATYLDTVGSPLSRAGGCGCPTLTAEVLGDAPYTTPQEDGAPWYDPTVPESGEFAGLMVLSVEGLEDHPVRRAVTGAVAGGGVLGARRVQPRTIAVTGVLLGATCCGVAYGLHWLAAALDQAGCGQPREGCDGADLTAFNCCPSAQETQDPASAARHLRTFRRVALTQGPTIVERSGDGCSGSTGCDVGAEMLTVEFVLTAATPWAWTPTEPVIEIDPPAPLPVEDCPTRWCVHRPGQDDPCEGTCRNAPCAEPGACSDPSCRTPTPPVPAPPGTCFCHAATVNTECYELDLSPRASSASVLPVITVTAGSSDMRRVTISVYERTADHDGLDCAQVAEMERCNPHSQIQIGYVPADGTLLLDGQVGRATVECGGRAETATDVWGAQGAPVSWRPLDCERYCVCISVDAMWPAAPDAMISIAVSGRGY
jgi:hypothetical protein